MMNFKNGGQYIYDFVKKIIDITGPRLPGSAEEKLGADNIAKEMKEITGNTVHEEEFRVAPKASIGAIPILGWMGIVCLISYFISPIISTVLVSLVLLFAIIQIFTYTGLLDRFFKQETSTNVYTYLNPSEGDYKYTIILSGHIDSSWNWNHSNKRTYLFIPKVAIGILCFVILLIISLISLIKYRILYFLPKEWTNETMTLYILPIFTIIGFYWLIKFLSWDKSIAAPGAMDNLSGIGLAIALTKHFKENPQDHPKGARIMCLALGSEEAGLKGSFAFCEKHKGEEWLKDAYSINLDSFRDYDHFNVVKGDLWLFSRFDKDLQKIVLESIEESGLKSHTIINPIGGCDSTPLYRAGVKTVTFNAQNPIITDYYHTYKDTVEGLNMDTLEKSCEVLYRAIKKIEKENNKQVIKPII